MKAAYVSWSFRCLTPVKGRRLSGSVFFVATYLTEKCRLDYLIWRAA